MINKFLITIIIPTIELEFDLYIPNNKKIGTIKKNVLSAVADLSDGFFVETIHTVKFVNKFDSTEYANDILVKDSSIKNGDKIIIL